MSDQISMKEMPLSFIGTNMYMKDMKKIIKSPSGGIKINPAYQIFIQQTASLQQSKIDQISKDDQFLCKELTVTCIIVDKHQAWPEKFCAVIHGGKDENCSTWYDFPFTIQKRKKELSEIDWKIINDALIPSN